MFQRKPRRFRRRMNDRIGSAHSNGGHQGRVRSNSFSNGQRNKFNKTSLSAEKLFEKYNVLAKEAMSSGDKTLYENYLQHADHFMRIIEDKNRNQNQIKTESENKTPIDEKTDSQESNSLKKDSDNFKS